MTDILRGYAKKIHDAIVGAIEPDGGVFAGIAMIQRAKKIMMVGNGGSAATCSHIGFDLMWAAKSAPVVNLCEPGALTSLGNDVGFDDVFAKQVGWHSTPGGLLIALSCSGNSLNILNAAEEAKRRHMDVMTLSGFSPYNSLRKLGDLNIYVPSSEYGIVQIAHEAILHCMVDRMAEDHK